MSGDRQPPQRPTGEVKGPSPAIMVEQRAVEQRTSTGETVTVACKIPSGIILHLDDMVEETEPTPTGFRTIKVARKREKTYIAVGPAIDIARLQADRGLHKIVASGYGLTPDIPKEFWDEWLAQHKNDPLVINGLIFSRPTESSARAQAREMKDVESGLEPVDPANPMKRMPRGSMLRIEPGNRSDT